MTWIPLAVCAAFLLAYARALVPKPPAAGECIFCAAQVHAPTEHQAEVATTVTTDPEPLSA